MLVILNEGLGGAYRLLKGDLKMDSEVAEVPNDAEAQDWHWQGLGNVGVVHHFPDLPKDAVYQHHTQPCHVERVLGYFIHQRLYERS